MKFTIAALTFALANSIELTESPVMPQSQMPAMHPEDERTIIGFYFKGFDFGNLWSKLTTEQKETIKHEVFAETLKMNNIDDTKFTENYSKIKTL